MKLLIIRPIISNREDALEEEIFRPFLAPDVEVSARRLSYGSSSIESEYDAAVNATEIIRVAVEGEKEGFDGAIINCFVDPALEAVREAVSYPVVGAGSASVQLALSVGRRIAIITIVPNLLTMINRLYAEHIVNGRICAIRSINVQVVNIYSDDLIYDKLYEEAVKAICEDKADTVILGCTGLGGMAQKVQRRLSESGYDIPVIDPVGASVTLLEALVRNNLSQSKAAWMFPEEKERRLK